MRNYWAMVGEANSWLTEAPVTELERPLTSCWLSGYRSFRGISERRSLQLPLATPRQGLCHVQARAIFRGALQEYIMLMISDY